MGCEGLRCGGCAGGLGSAGGGGGGSGRSIGGVLALILLVILIICGVAAHRQIEETADTIGHIVAVTAEVILGILAAAVAGVVGYGAVRIGMYVRARTAARPRQIHMQALAQPGQALSQGPVLQIDPVHRMSGLQDALIPESAPQKQRNF